MERYLNEREAAALTGHSPRTYQRWRWKGGGPPFRKIGSSVRYAPDELRAWLEAQRRTSTSDPGTREHIGEP